MKGTRYNRVFGENKYARELLAMLDMERKDFGRFRDIFTSHGGEHIVVYTRTGGVFRKYYQQEYANISRHPLVVHACDDRNDNTYHYITFQVAPLYRERTEDIFNEQGEVVSVHNKFKALESELTGLTPEQMEKDPRFAEDIKLVKNLKPGQIANTQDEDVPPGYNIYKEGLHFSVD